MESAKSENKMECISLVPENIPEEITESDYQNFLKVISIDLNENKKPRLSIRLRPFLSRKLCLQSIGILSLYRCI